MDQVELSKCTVCRYELKAQGKLPAAAQEHVPHAYLHNVALSGGVIDLEERLKEAKGVAAKASCTWNTLRKERDFHRMHHKRVNQVWAHMHDWRTMVHAFVFRPPLLLAFYLFLGNF
jgi:hypothetical protein